MKILAPVCLYRNIAALAIEPIRNIKAPGLSIILSMPLSPLPGKSYHGLSDSIEI